MDLSGPSCLGYNIGEEFNEVRAGVSACCLALDFSGFHVESGVERQGTVPIIFEAMALGSAGGKGQDRNKLSSAWMAVFSSTQNTAAC